MKIVRRSLRLTALVAAWGCLFPAAGAAIAQSTADLNPVKDAFSTPGSAANPRGNNLGDNNYGGTGSLAVAAPGSTKGQFDSVMTFDLSSAVTQFNTAYGATNWDILSLQIRMTVSPANNTIFNANGPATVTVGWLPNGDAYTEGSGTPNVPQTPPPADLIRFNYLPTLTAGEVALGSLAIDAAGATDGTSNFFVLPLDSGLVSDIKAGGLVSFHFGASTGSLVFTSRTTNSTVPPMPPMLSVGVYSSVPEPSSLALVGCAAAGWLGRARRRGSAIRLLA